MGWSIFPSKSSSEPAGHVEAISSPGLQQGRFATEAGSIATTPSSPLSNMPMSIPAPSTYEAIDPPMQIPSLGTPFGTDDSLHPRLNMPFPARVTVFSVLSFSTGFLLGASIGGPEAALRYRAMNAHRLPTSTPGWYLYHKSKNYHTITGGVKKGLTTGLRMSAWGILFLAVEETFDKWKGEKDFTSSAGAGLTMAGAFSWINHRGDIFTAARTTRIALVGGVAFGLVQDALMWLRGDVPVYVRWAREGKTRIWGDGQTTKSEQSLQSAP